MKEGLLSYNNKGMTIVLRELEPPKLILLPPNVLPFVITHCKPYFGKENISINKLVGVVFI